MSGWMIVVVVLMVGVFAICSFVLVSLVEVRRQLEALELDCDPISSVPESCDGRIEKPAAPVSVSSVVKRKPVYISEERSAEIEKRLSEETRRRDPIFPMRG